MAVPVGRDVAQVYHRGLGAGCLVNTDLTNPVFVAHSRAGIDSGADQVPPLGSIAVDGSHDIYASTLAPGVTVRMQAMPGVTQWTPSPAQVAQQLNALGLATAANQSSQLTAAGTANNLLGGATPGALVSGAGRTVGQEVAALIASGNAGGTPGGTPLLHGFDALASGASANLGAGGSQFPNYTFTKPGYVISINAAVAAAATVPFLLVNLFWKDPTGNFTMNQESFLIPAVPGPGQYIISGSGPIRGPILTLGLQNQDPAQAMTVNYTLLETTAHLTRVDWRGIIPGGVVPGITRAPNDSMTFGLLYSIPPATPLGAGAQVIYLMPLYCGKVAFQFQASANVQVFVGPPSQLAAYAAGSNSLWVDQTLTDITIELDLPRIPCVVSFKNTGGAGVTIQSMANILEYAS